MTKLSDIREDPTRDAQGEWKHMSGTAFVRIRRLGSRAYQRALRRYQIERGEFTQPTEIEARLDFEEKLEADLVPILAAHVVADWTFDADAEPVELAPTNVETITTGDGHSLTVAEHGGKRYRKDGELWQELLPWTPEASVAALTDPGNAVLLDFVRTWANLLNVARIKRAADILGKSSKPPSGK